MEFYILITLSLVLGVFVSKNRTNKKRLKEYKEVIDKQTEVLNLYRETVYKYESILNGTDVRNGETPKKEDFDLDEILLEISKFGIENISKEKISYLEKFKK